MKIAGLEVQNTSNLFDINTRICHLLFSEAKRGKTTLAGSLNAFTLKYLKKPTLFIACESSDGGGTATIKDMGVDYVIPSNHTELQSVIDYLKTDTKYGGVVWDNLTDAVKGIIQPYALKFPSKEKILVREMGVPDRGDYQSMGEFLRKLLSPLVALTRHENLEIRKHVVCCALLKEKTTPDGKALVAIQPSLPGAMATDATAMFQTVSMIGINKKVMPDSKGVNRAIYQRVLTSDSDGVLVAGDRWKVHPKEILLTNDDGSTLGFTEIYEQYWLPKINKQ